MMMLAASLTARAAIFDDDVGRTFLHEQAAAPPERTSLIMMSAASLTARAAIFDDDVGGTSLHERAAAPPERASDGDVSGEFGGQDPDF